MWLLCVLLVVFSGDILIANIQCVYIHSQWYKQSSVWRNPTQSAYLISILYDLNDITFDLGAQGYDLDNGWPTFSRLVGKFFIEKQRFL